MVRHRFDLLIASGLTPLRDRPLMGPYGLDLRQPPSGPLYLYLANPEWMDAWVDGGTIPCVPARDHLGERGGTKTPDEVRQERWDGASDRQLAAFVELEGRGFKNIRVTGCSQNGRRLRDTRVDMYDEEALLLCFSSALDDCVMQGLEKTCCVEIVAFDKLLKSLMSAFPRVLHGYMKYTIDNERSHFMRSIEDEWMQEFRVVIPGDREETWITIPAGIARKVDVSLTASLISL